MNDKKKLLAGRLLLPNLFLVSLLLPQNGYTQGQDRHAAVDPRPDQSGTAEKEPQEKQNTAQNEALDTRPVPVTGPVRPPAPRMEPVIRSRLEQLLDTSSEGLREEKMNGAVRLNLRGRFRTVPVATIDEQGEVEITDYTHLPAE